MTGSQKDCGSSVNAFTYELSDGTSEDNYSFSKSEGLLTVAKATQNAVTVDIENWIYGSAVSTPTVSAQFGNPVITYARQGTEGYSSTPPGNAGEYVVRAVVAETENYVGGSATKEFEIEKADSMVVPPTPISGLVYTGTAQELVVSGTATGGTMEYTLGSAEQPEEKFTTAIPTVTDAGTYHVWYRAIGDQNHNDFAPACVQAIVDRKTLTITAGSAEKAYDGITLSRNSYSSEGLVGNDQIVSVSIHGSQKLVGHSANVVENAEIKNGDQVVTWNYEIVYRNGTLIITNRTNEEGPNQKYGITVEAENNTMTYDGNTHTVDGLKELDFTINGVTYTVSGLSASVTGTNAGEYISEVNGKAVVQDSDGNDLTDQFIISRINGKLVIDRRNVTLTSASDTKVYDGHALTADNVTIGGDGFAAGEGAIYAVSGSQTIPGETVNSFTYTLYDNTNVDNYIITKKEGTLIVENRTDEGEETVRKYSITVEANSGEFDYDGSEHTVSGFRNLEFVIGGVRYIVSGLVAEGKGTNIGTWPVSVSGTAIVTDEAGNDLTANFIVETKEGVLLINRAEPEIVPQIGGQFDFTRGIGLNQTAVYYVDNDLPLEGTADDVLYSDSRLFTFEIENDEELQELISEQPVFEVSLTEGNVSFGTRFREDGTGGQVYLTEVPEVGTAVFEVRCKAGGETCTEEISLRFEQMSSKPEGIMTEWPEVLITKVGDPIPVQPPVSFADNWNCGKACWSYYNVNDANAIEWREESGFWRETGCCTLQLVARAENLCMNRTVHAVITNVDGTLPAAKYSPLGSVFILPAALTEIGAEAFAGIPLTEVDIPGGVARIDDSAFDGTGLVAVYTHNNRIVIDYAVNHGYVALTE